MNQLSIYFKLLLSLLLSFALLSASAIADDDDDDDDDDKRGKQKNRHPIDLEIISPVPPKKYKSKKPKKSKNIQYRSGWPLTFKLVTTDEFLLGTLVQYAEMPHGAYPEAGEASALVFEDPDNCPSIQGRTNLGATIPCPEDPDEVFLEFTPGVDFPGLTDFHGREDIRALQDSPAAGPEWGGPVLPELVGGASDGVGYGPNDDLPGLVLLSNVGVGIVYAPLVMENIYGPICPEGSGECSYQLVDPRPVDWKRAGPDSGHLDYLIEARHNLSGLMGSVAYELNDQRRRTTITTSLVVPRGLFTHQVLEDSCYTGDGTVVGCPSVHKVARIIDGGPIVTDKTDPAFPVHISHAEIRAFVVNGDAPAIIEECDGKEGVTAADVECNVDPSTGGFYSLISNEVVLNVEQRGGEIEGCNDLIDPWGFMSFTNSILLGADFDLNTPEIILDSECPGGSGGTSRPPR